MLTLKKSLGQHFLTDESVSHRIIDVIVKAAPKRVLEVGPGGGALTKHLVKVPEIEFKCVEIDEEKVQYLRNAYPALAPNIIHADILQSEPPFEGRFLVVGNFPYNISTEILFRMLDWKDRIDGMVGMFQKEVAARVAAREGSRIYGVTSVLIQAFYSVEYLFEVDEHAFEPPPKVKSAVIRMVPLDSPVEMKDYRSYSVLVKTAFNQRRKTLRNAVRSLFRAEVLQDPLFDKRAEQLSVSDFAALTHRMH